MSGHFFYILFTKNRKNVDRWVRVVYNMGKNRNGVII